MTDSAPLVHLVASHSHLFRGSRLTGAASELPRPLKPSAVVVSFSDGVQVEAELLADTTSAGHALAVPSYQTAIGHPVAAAIWPVVEFDIDEDEGRASIKLGQRLG